MSKQIAIIIVALLIVVAIFIVIWKMKFAAPSEEKITEQQQQQQAPSLKKEQGGEITDCGILSNLKSREEQLQVKNCWEEKFKTCQPAKVVFSTQEAGAKEPTDYYLEILGPGESEHACRIKSRFLNTSNTSWIGKEMICNYNNKLTFDAAYQGLDLVKDCSGSLIGQ